MALSNQGKRRLSTALGDKDTANAVLGSLGVYGGFRVNADASVQLSAGDFVAVPDSGGAAGTYRVFMPGINAQIQSIDWIHCKGFTPRAPTGVELNDARVCGYNFDATKGQWYITVQIALLSNGAVNATPPAGFTIGLRAAVTLLPTANRQ